MWAGNSSEPWKYYDGRRRTGDRRQLETPKPKHLSPEPKRVHMYHHYEVSRKRFRFLLPKSVLVVHIEP